MANDSLVRLLEYITISLRRLADRLDSSHGGRHRRQFGDRLHASQRAWNKGQPG